MKNMKTLRMILLFLGGIIIGCGIMWLVCCNCMTCGNSCCGGQNLEDTLKLPPVSKISLDSAKASFRCYMKAPVNADTLRAFSVNLEQYHAMMLLLKDNPRLKGFRMYMGVIGDPVDVLLVTGTDDNGADVCSTIFTTDRSSAGPCPKICDKESPIIQD
jgi:hypothetical protein